VMMAPLSARMDISSRYGGRFTPGSPCELLAEHTQTTAHDEQDACQDDEDAAATTSRPGSMRPLGIEVAAAPKQRSAAAIAHGKFSVRK
jgi:hypothetical protein